MRLTAVGTIARHAELGSADMIGYLNSNADVMQRSNGYYFDKG